MPQTPYDMSQTPTQANEQGRMRGVVMRSSLTYQSMSKTEIIESREEGIGEDSSLPAPAQTRKNVFETLIENAVAASSRLEHPNVPSLSFDAQGFAAPAITKKKNRFIDTEADLSDEEEGGMGGASGDEDETGLDAEDVDLVDNTVVARELREKQDALANELHL